MPNSRSMVLRSVNVPFQMEEQLRSIAFLLRIPKSDVIRWCINEGLSILVRQLKENPQSRMADAAREFRIEVSEEEQRARERDVHKLLAARAG